ncbi:MAG TPA: methyltransferase domain-containing protein [Chthoniobacterales bacterium]|jgi:predicted SAM-dependent methyltransferase
MAPERQLVDQDGLPKVACESKSATAKLLLRLFEHQTLYWVRSDLISWIHLLRSRLTFSFFRSKSAALFLNFGAGSYGRPGEEWFNVDGFRGKNIDLVHLFRGSLPFETNRFRGIFCEHFLEHLIPSVAQLFLFECRRVLLPGGILRLSVPDGELYLRRYFDDRSWMLDRRGGRHRTPMEVVNVVFRQRYEHQYCYDFETLALYLRDAGFASVRRMEYCHGEMPELLIDREDRRFESLYIEASA